MWLAFLRRKGVFLKHDLQLLTASYIGYKPKCFHFEENFQEILIVSR